MDDIKGSRVVSTKVSEDAYQRLHRASKLLSLDNTYNLLKVNLHCLLKFIDKPAEASYTLKELWNIMFGNWKMWRVASLITTERGPENPLELGKSILFLHERGKDINSQFAVMMDRGFMGRVDATYNVQDMFELFLKVTMPAQYKQLQKVMRDIDTGSAVEAFSYLLNRESGMDDIEAEVMAMFQDNNRVGFGQQGLEYDKKYKNHHHFSIDTAKVNRDEQGQAIQQADLFSDMEKGEE